MLVGFDLDWTIRRTRSGKVFPENVSDWELMPGRLEKIRTLREESNQIAFLTNQGGLLWQVATGQDKYPTPQQLGEALKPIIMEINATSSTPQYPWYISLYDQKAVDLINKNINREIFANADMAGYSADDQASPEYEEAEEILMRLQKELFEALQQFNVRISIDPSWRKPAPGMLIVAMRENGLSAEDTLFVGDRPEDKAAADAAGCSFMFAKEYFSS